MCFLCVVCIGQASHSTSVDDGNGHNDGQNDAGLSRSAFEVINSLSAEKNDGGNKTEEVDPGPSCLRGCHSTQSYGRK